jgi:hypothetical protein
MRDDEITDVLDCLRRAWLRKPELRLGQLALSGWARCREHSLTPWHGAFSGLAGRHCSWPGADRRVATMNRILRGLRVAP